MKLAYSPSSPWVRRVAVAVSELGLDDQVDRISVDNQSADSDYANINPLMKVPALILDEGGVLIDSLAISEYLDRLQGEGRLFWPPGERRVRRLQVLVLANGLQEAATQITGERVRRPEPLRWPQFIDKLLVKFTNGLNYLEKNVDEPAGQVDYAQIAVAVLCAHMDFRLADLLDWRDGHPGLAAWFENFAARSSMKGSEFSVRS